MAGGKRLLYAGSDITAGQVIAVMLDGREWPLDFIQGALAQWLDERSTGLIDISHFFFPTARGRTAFVGFSSLLSLARQGTWTYMHSSVPSNPPR
jgi:hypothetical protein